MKVFRVIKVGETGFIHHQLVQEVQTPLRSEWMKQVGAYWVRGDRFVVGEPVRPIIQCVFTQGKNSDVQELEDNLA